MNVGDSVPVGPLLSVVQDSSSTQANHIRRTEKTFNSYICSQIGKKLLNSDAMWRGTPGEQEQTKSSLSVSILLTEGALEALIAQYVIWIS